MGARRQSSAENEAEDGYTERQHNGDAPRKKSRYDSRVEQMLFEDPDVPIVIVDAGKSHESGGSYIVYTIRTGVCSISSLDIA